MNMHATARIIVGKYSALMNETIARNLQKKTEFTHLKTNQIHFKVEKNPPWTSVFLLHLFPFEILIRTFA